MASLYKIGTTSGNKVALSTLTQHDPQPALAYYAEYIKLGDGTRRGAGWIMAEWRWKYISWDEIAALKTYCTGISAAVYITTPDNEGDWTDYSARMHWPQITEPLHGAYAEDFVIEFTELVAAGGTT